MLVTAVHSEDLELLERLGGTEATVHRGMVRATGRVVVVKLAAWDRPDVVDRLGREAAVLRRVQHPSLVRLLDAIDDEQGRMLVLAHAPGGSLASRLERHGPLPAAEVADLGTRLAEALAALHRAGIVHRDVHPGNVVVDAELQPVLADLDHALDQQSGHLHSDDEVVGHPDHVDPRLFAGAPVGPANDLHGLATTLWTAATGAPPPRSAPDQQVILPDDPRVPGPLRRVCDACLTGEVDAAAAATELRAASIELLQRPLDAASLPPQPLPAGAAATPGPPPPPGAPPAVGRGRLVAGTGEASTRRWGPATSGQRRLGAGTDAQGRRWSPRRVVSFAVGFVVLVVGVSRLIGAFLPEDPARGGSAAAAVTAVAEGAPVVPPPACRDESAEHPHTVLADLDGDGCSEALRLEDGVLHAPAGRFHVGEAGDVLVAGDWDGDGAWGVGLYRPATGHVFLFDDAPGPGARSRPAGRLAPGGTPVVVSSGGAHTVELAPAGSTRT